MKILMGKGKFDSPGKTATVTQSEIIGMLEATRQEPRHPALKDDSRWICPAILKPDATGRKANDVERMSAWIGLDMDAPGWTVERLCEALAGIGMVIYSTASSTFEKPRWRVVMFLSRECSIEEYMGIWQACNALLDHELDIKTKNANRILYMPAAYTGKTSNNVFEIVDGGLLDVDEFLRVCPAERWVPLSGELEVLQGNPCVNGEILTAKMKEKFALSPEGGRFFKLLCSAATRYKRNGWLLNADDLAREAEMFSPIDPHGVKRNARYEAMRAVAWVNDNVETETALERRLSKLRFRMGRI